MPSNAEIGYNSKVEGEVIVTRVDAALNWFRKNSVWPMPMGLACCAIELMAAGDTIRGPLPVIWNFTMLFSCGMVRVVSAVL